jgi:hypothetical protein
MNTWIKWLGVWVLTLIILATTRTIGHAEFTLKDYERFRGKEMLLTYISGVGRGYTWTNTWLQTRKQPLLFCPPEDLAIRGENFVDILDNQIAWMGERGLSSTSMELTLLKGLMRVFPCT